MPLCILERSYALYVSFCGLFVIVLLSSNLYVMYNYHNNLWIILSCIWSFIDEGFLVHGPLHWSMIYLSSTNLRLFHHVSFVSYSSSAFIQYFKKVTYIERTKQARVSYEVSNPQFCDFLQVRVIFDRCSHNSQLCVSHVQWFPC